MSRSQARQIGGDGPASRHQIKHGAANPPAHILIVDDRRTNRAIVSAALRSANYNVTEATGGEEALARLQRGAFDLVILDIVMPDMSGLEVLKVVRESHSESELPIIMVTVKQDSDDTVEALELGANDYVTKPIDFPVLFARIRSHLSRKHAEEALREAQQELERRVEERTAEFRHANQLLREEVAEREQAEKALLASEERFKDFAEIAADWFWEMGSDLRYRYLSGRYQEVMGVYPDQVMGRTRKEVYEGRVVNAEVWERHLEDLDARRTFESVEFGWRRADGTIKILLLSGKPIFDGNRVFQGYRGVGRDVTEQHALAQQLSYQASHDTLTGLVNRREFERRLDRVLHSSHEDDTEHALCYLDLDQFKVVNDTCGHVAGDELLRQLANLLQGRVRTRDTLARLGGDEFGILFEHCSMEKAKRVAETIRQVVEDYQFVWEKERFSVGVSIGLAPINHDVQSKSELMRQADTACYVAKEAGRNRIHVYRLEDTMQSRQYGQMQWAVRITQALEQKRFQLAFQPITPVAAEDRGGVHYELLLRMERHDGRIATPASFLPAAERYNLSTKLDRWVIATAFRWLASEPVHREHLTFCAINLSGLSLADSTFLEFVLEQFDECSIEPSAICFEITETAAISNLVAANEFIRALKQRGCQFALDDFGSGLSSFAYLKNLPVDYLKIDGELVKGIANELVDLAMVKSINEMGHALGKKIIAEFVENEAILSKLEELGIDYAQGYHIGPPQPLSKMPSFVDVT